MFITEQQLALYKYQAGSKYFNKPMARIALNEFIQFSESVDKSPNLKNYNVDVISLFSYFLNKRLSENLWKIFFSDESFLIIRFENNGYLFEVFTVDNSFDHPVSS